MRTVRIYTDGGCAPTNPGPGGWGAILIDEQTEKRKELLGGEAKATNNRMELLAALTALKSLKYPCKVVLTSDSQYLINAFNKGWLAGWKDCGRLESDHLPNAELWRELDQQAQIHDITWCWVRGHSGHPENERADALATEGRRRVLAEATGPSATVVP